MKCFENNPLVRKVGAVEHAANIAQQQSTGNQLAALLGGASILEQVGSASTCTSVTLSSKMQQMRLGTHSKRSATFLCCHIPALFFEHPTVLCNCTALHCVQAFEQPGNGRVLVVDGGGSKRCALLGDNIAEMAHKNGWSVSGKLARRTAAAAEPHMFRLPY